LTGTSTNQLIEKDGYDSPWHQLSASICQFVFMTCSLFYRFWRSVLETGVMKHNMMIQLQLPVKKTTHRPHIPMQIWVIIFVGVV